MRVLAWFMLHTGKHKTYSHADPGGPVLYFVIYYRKFRVFPVFPVFLVYFRFFSVSFETVCFSCFASLPKQFKREYIWVFFRKFRVVSVCFGLLRNSSVCFDCFDIGSKHRNRPNFLVFGFTKQTETNAKQILFRFVSVRTEIYFCSFRGHPIRN